jgi:hypothetical protein
VQSKEEEYDDDDDDDEDDLYGYNTTLSPITRLSLKTVAATFQSEKQNLSVMA